ncbi:hypothetical protein HNQ77_000985 [Silvibacterium bohemicum]|uniref:Uncharacterized protein n=1 Tax=Silvibacterium bohemicum TaxID=1577686 RepID=A0A841JVM3_9BACT|nr:hypothetical protein [Silvibacterium bohemicum]MBB6143041.1 hypothetical protein [Silvibacterium bohemicum]
MSVMSFLGGLPALLGIAGFFAYLWVGQSKIGGELLKDIVQRLRTNPNLDLKAYGDLSPAKLGKLVESDSRIKDSVNAQDQKLLRLLIILQHGLTVIVLLVSAGLVGLSVWLISRPQPLSVTVKAPTDVNKDAEGLLVDLDPLDVQWQSQGVPETVTVFLENVDTGAQSGKRTPAADIRDVVFSPSEVHQVATDRGYHHKNRIRSVVEWSKGKATSQPVDLLVGINVELALYGQLIAASGKTGVIHTLVATIDDDTAALPTDYCFTVDMVGRSKTSAVVIPLNSCNADTQVSIPGLNTLDWTRPLGLVYNTPDDRKIVRTQVTGHP